MCQATTPAPTRVVAIAILPYILLFFSILDSECLLSLALAPVRRASSADMGTSVASRYWEAKPEEGAMSVPMDRELDEDVEVGDEASDVAGALASEAAASASLAPSPATLASF